MQMKGRKLSNSPKITQARNESPHVYCLFKKHPETVTKSKYWENSMLVLSRKTDGFIQD
jgi:hypothetical protein